MKRGKPLPRVNRARRARRKAEDFGPQAELCRTLPCCACGHRAPSDPAHVRSRGAGGHDRGNVVPLCRRPGGCHEQQHRHGWEALYLGACVPPSPKVPHAGHVRSWAEGVARGLEVAAYGAWA